ncbi:MAG: hypothetical protein J0H37_08380, partial [Hyphomicrobium denitrificans]|nr:hypothetical protein [Hyphomicrobium denitrificans]
HRVDRVDDDLFAGAGSERVGRFGIGSFCGWRPETFQRDGDPFQQWPYCVSVAHLKSSSYLLETACLIATSADANAKQWRRSVVANRIANTIVRPEFD